MNRSQQGPTTWSIGLLAPVLLTAACQIKTSGLFRMSSSPSRPTARAAEVTAAPTAAPPPPATGPAAPATSGVGADPALVALFQRLTIDNLQANHNWGDSFDLFEQQDIDLERAPTTATPDAHWLPGWPGGLRGGKLTDAFVQGAINRTWTARCADDYADYQAKWAPVERRVRAQIAALPANPYLHAQGLFAALAELTEAERHQAVLPISNPGRWSGLRFEIVEDLVTAARGHAPLIHGWYPSIAPYLALGRRTPDDAQVAHDLFCRDGAEHGTHRTGAVMTTASADAIQQVVRPVDWARPDRARALAQVFTAAEKARAAMRVPDDDLAEHEFRLLDQSYRPGDHVTVDGTLVSARGGALTLKVRRDEVGWEGCKSTHQVDGIDADGRVSYQKSCTPVHDITEALITVTAIADFPAAIALRPGDVVTVYGRITAWKEGPEQRAGRTSLVEKAMAMTDASVGHIRRGKTLVAAFDGTTASQAAEAADLAEHD
jgi:hypothetical protein